MLAMPHWETVGITMPDEQVQSLWHALPAGHVPALPSQFSPADVLTVPVVPGVSGISGSTAGVNRKPMPGCGGSSSTTRRTTQS